MVADVTEARIQGFSQRLANNLNYAPKQKHRFLLANIPAVATV
jgi:hypothetical protein